MQRRRANHIAITAHDGVRIALESTTPLECGQSFLAILRTYLAGAEVATGAAATALCTDGLILHRETTNRMARIDASTVCIGDSWNGLVGPDAFHLLHAMARRKWLESGLFATPAACLQAPSGDGILIAGHSRAGKTTTAFAMIRRGARLFSGSTTLLGFSADGMLAFGGTDTETVNADAHMVEDLLDGSTSRYGRRVAGRLLSEHRTESAPLRISKIILPNLNDGVRDRRVLGPLEGLHTLHPLMMDRVNSNVILAGGKAIYCDQASTRIAIACADGLSLTLPGLQVSNVSGPLDFVVEEALR